MVILSVIAAVAVAGLAAWALTMRGSSSNTNILVPIGNNGNTSANNVNANSLNTNIVENASTTNTSANSNTSSTTNTSSNTNSSTTNIGVDAALAQPSLYDGKRVCLAGDFQKSFETQVFGTQMTTDAYGNPSLDGPYVYASGTVTTTGLTCDQAERQTCTGTKTLCGTFKVATSTDGFTSQHYRYELIIK